MGAPRTTLRLTEYERTWNDYYTRDGRYGVMQRWAPASTQLSAATQAQTLRFSNARRVRVFGVSWAGDVTRFRVMIRRSTGENYTYNPTHIPLVSGHSVYSPRTTLGAAPVYPDATFGWALQAAPAWSLVWDPNIVLEGGSELTFDYTLEDPLDRFLVSAPPRICQVVHYWEFPGFEGKGL